MEYSAPDKSIAAPADTAGVPHMSGAGDTACVPSYPPKTGYAQLIRQFYAVIVVCVSGASVLTVGDPSQSLVLLAWSLLCGLAPFVLFANMPGGYFLQGVACLLSVYFWIAYPVKAIFSQTYVQSDLILNYYVPPHLFADCLAPSIAYSVCGLLATAAALRFLAGKAVDRTTATRRPNIRLLLTVTFFALLLKAIIHYWLGWGLPGLEPPNAIPLVTGAIVMLCRLGIFHLISVAIFIAISHRNLPARYKYLTGLSACAYLALDMGIGSKYSLAYLGTTLLSASIVGLRRTKANTRKLAAVLVSVTCIVACYPFVQQYRFVRLGHPNAAPTQLIDRAIKQTFERTDYNVVAVAFLSVLERINGFQNYCAARAYNVNASWGHMLASRDLTASYTTSVLGFRSTNTAMGLTQVSVLSSLAKHDPVILAALTFSFCFVLTAACAGGALAAIRSAVNAAAAGLTIGLFLVFCLFTGGDLLFLGKQYFVICATVFFVDATGQRSAAQQRSATA
ncbi:MAG: hypothetical protein CMJ58_15415 [Planctomycetaceae bacterium]|nr:hypothetical protein [Planctomycetaceae bacterium]